MYAAVNKSVARNMPAYLRDAETWLPTIIWIGNATDGLWDVMRLSPEMDSTIKMDIFKKMSAVYKKWGITWVELQDIIEKAIRDNLWEKVFEDWFNMADMSTAYLEPFSFYTQIPELPKEALDAAWEIMKW
jgi:hypothetical protein